MHLSRSIIGRHLSHIMVDHEFNELLEGSRLRVPSEFGFGFSRITEEVDHIGGAIEVFGYCYNGIAYFHVGASGLVQVDEDDDLPAITPDSYMKIKGGKFDPIAGFRKSGKHIAVLYATGDIVDDGNEGIVGSKMVPEIIDLANDKDVAGVVLRVNSGGGSAFASEQIWEAFEYLKKRGKPFYVSMADYAASGGYYISCGADRTFTEAPKGITISGSFLRNSSPGKVPRVSSN